MIIEKLDEKHIESIVEIEKECFSAPWSKTSFMDELNNKNAYYFVVCENEKVIGYGGFWYIINECHITNIAVTEKYRGKKVGSLIISEMIKIAKELFCVGLTLEVRESNNIAINFYEGFGFVTEGIRKNYYENKENALIMWLNFE